jgi:hypothetical protein
MSGTQTTKLLAFEPLMRALLPPYVAEHKFAVEAFRRQWRFDYAWPELKIALEVEGATFAGGRHSTGAGLAEDARKYNRAAALGWCLVRVTTTMIRDRTALDELLLAFTHRGYGHLIKGQQHGSSATSTETETGQGRQKSFL